MLVALRSHYRGFTMCFSCFPSELLKTNKYKEIKLGNSITETLRLRNQVPKLERAKISTALLTQHHNN